MKRIAVVTTVYSYLSHAQHIGDRFLVGVDPLVAIAGVGGVGVLVRRERVNPLLHRRQIHGWRRGRRRHAGGERRDYRVARIDRRPP